MKTWVPVLTATLLSACATAQPGRLDIPAYPHLRVKASDTTSLNLSGRLLRMALRLSGEAQDDRDARQLLAELDGVQVRSFEFPVDGAYSSRDVEAVRRQLLTPDWSQAVKLRDRKSGEQVDIFICLVDGKPRGLAIIAAEPRQLTIVNLVGSIGIEALARMDGQFGIPKL